MIVVAIVNAKHSKAKGAGAIRMERGGDGNGDGKHDDNDAQQLHKYKKSHYMTLYAY
jgi:hypothetical protein